MSSINNFSILIFSLFSTVAAVDFSHWSPPGLGDVRSPCPGLNSLANHGILPRNGKQLTIPMLNVALLEGFNVGNDFSTAIGAAGLLSSPNPAGGSFDLDNLDKHNFPIEHDASLSRADFYEGGDDHTFNQTIFDTVLAYYNGMTVTSIPVASKARYNRVSTEAARDTKFTYTPQQLVLSYGETALYLSVMGDPITGIAPLSYVKIFFEQERLPYNEGWRPPLLETNLPSLAAMIVQLQVASGELLPEGLLLTTNTLRLAFQGNDPLTGKPIVG